MKNLKRLSGQTGPISRRSFSIKCCAQTTCSSQCQKAARLSVALGARRGRAPTIRNRSRATELAYCSGVPLFTDKNDSVRFFPTYGGRENIMTVMDQNETVSTNPHGRA